MTELFDMLTTEPSITGSDDQVYDDAAVRGVANVIVNLEDNGLLAVCERGHAVSFVVFRLAYGPATKDGVVVSGSKWAHVFHGNGFSDSLRELRHTFWGEADNAGYIFYPSGELITDAFKQLARWFDA